MADYTEEQRGEWYCFSCDAFVQPEHIRNVCDNGAMTGDCGVQNPEIQRIETLTDEELDAELRSYGLDPDELHKRMLERLLKARAEGHDTPMLREAIRQFSEVGPLAERKEG